MSPSQSQMSKAYEWNGAPPPSFPPWNPRNHYGKLPLSLVVRALGAALQNEGSFFPSLQMCHRPWGCHLHCWESGVA